MYTIFLACVFHVETKSTFSHLKRKINIYGLILKFHDTTNISIVCIQKSIINTGALAPPSIILHTQQNSCFLHCSFGHIIRPSQCTFLSTSLSINYIYSFCALFLCFSFPGNISFAILFNIPWVVSSTELLLVRFVQYAIAEETESWISYQQLMIHIIHVVSYINSINSKKTLSFNIHYIV